MKLLVVRHGTAEDKDEFARTGKSDDLRPLTPAGKREMRDIARGIREVVSAIDVLLTSPLVRAMQTAEIVGEEYDREQKKVEWLRPDAPYEEFARWARSAEEKQTIAVVGHEPHLSGLVSWLLAGADESFVELKKGAACVLEIEAENAGPSSATLVWSMAPKHLRAIGRG
jgi:phosphohistidine phosphatase